MNRKRWIIGLFSIMSLLSCSGERPPQVGTEPPQLAACPDSPNCVSSLSAQTDSQHFITPLSYQGTLAQAQADLLTVITSLPRTTVITIQPQYIYVEFTSLVFRFVDDVEFLLIAEQPLIHVRSTSRLGYSDFGVNRQRVETIRRHFEALNHR